MISHPEMIPRDWLRQNNANEIGSLKFIDITAGNKRQKRNATLDDFRAPRTITQFPGEATQCGSLREYN
jgi:hypothetical protein